MKTPAQELFDDVGKSVEKVVGGVGFAAIWLAIIAGVAWVAISAIRWVF